MEAMNSALRRPMAGRHLSPTQPISGSLTASASRTASNAAPTAGQRQPERFRIEGGHDDVERQGERRERHRRQGVLD